MRNEAKENVFGEKSISSLSARSKSASVYYVHTKDVAINVRYL